MRLSVAGLEAGEPVNTVFTVVFILNQSYDLGPNGADGWTARTPHDVSSKTSSQAEQKLLFNSNCVIAEIID